MVTDPQQAFEATTSLEHFSDNYQRALNDVVTGSNEIMGGLGSWVTNFEYSGMNLSDFLTRRTEMIGDTLSDTSMRIGEIIDAAPDILLGLSDFLDGSDKAYFNAASSINENPNMTILALNQRVGSTIVRSAIRAALDDTIYSSVRADFDVFPAAGRYKLDRTASSSVALRAMKVGLDDLVYDQGREMSWRGARTSVKDYFSEYASSVRAASAMATGIDGIVYESADQLGSNFALPTKEIQAGASTPEASKIIISTLLAARGQADTSEQPRQTRTGSEWSERARHARAGTTPPPREEAAPEPPKPEAEPEKTPYELLMDKLEIEDRLMFETVRAFDEKDVTRVMATVKRLREKNPKITDKQIAIKYARASNNVETTNPDRQRATQILMAFMDNKVSGELPF